MQFDITKATHIEVEAEVRYWEDATVDGIEDTNGNLIPFRDGDLWKVKINLADGHIEGWPNVGANIHYKVCDQGEYWLIDIRNDRRIAKYRSEYVPDDFLCHGDEGYGDYIIMKILSDGLIENYKKPKIKPEDWEIL